MQEKIKKLWEYIFSYINENKIKAIYLGGSFFVLMICATTLFFLTNVVRISDKDKTVVVLSILSDQNNLLKLADVTVDDGDKVLYTSYDGHYKDLTVKRKFSVDITVDGNITTATITQGTVSDCLDNAGITLGEYDFTVPGLHTIINEGDNIRVYRVEYKDTQYEETVPYETTYKYSSLTYRFKNRRYTIKSGVNGTNLVTYRERYVDGELDLALVSKVEVLEKPVNAVVLAYGNVPVSPLSAPDGVSVVNGVPTGYSYVISNVSATGYYSARGRGASGLGLFYGSVAVNPNVIPYGTKMYIASPDGQFIYGWAIATDTGTAVMENTIGVDLFYETYLESSLNWRNTVNIYVYG